MEHISDVVASLPTPPPTARGAGVTAGAELGPEVDPESKSGAETPGGTNAAIRAAVNGSDPYRGNNSPALSIHRLVPAVSGRASNGRLPPIRPVPSPSPPPPQASVSMADESPSMPVPVDVPPVVSMLAPLDEEVGTSAAGTPTAAAARAASTGVGAGLPANFGSLFDEALREVFTLLETDSFARFQQRTESQPFAYLWGGAFADARMAGPTIIATSSNLTLPPPRTVTTIRDPGTLSEMSRLPYQLTPSPAGSMANGSVVVTITPIGADGSGASNTALVVPPSPLSSSTDIQQLPAAAPRLNVSPSLDPMLWPTTTSSAEATPQLQSSRS
jgi:hypothetical protein